MSQPIVGGYGNDGLCQSVYYLKLTASVPVFEYPGTYYESIGYAMSQDGISPLEDSKALSTVSFRHCLRRVSCMA